MKEQTFSLSTIINVIASFVLAAYIFLLPLVFLPQMAGNVFDFPKWLLTVVAAIILTILWAVKMFVQKRILLPNQRYLIPMVLFLAANVATIMIIPGNKFIPLLGKAGILIAMTLILFSGLVLIKNKSQVLLTALFASSFLVSLLKILSFTQILPKILKGPLYADKVFTTLGSDLALASLLVVVLPLSLVIGLKTEAVAKKVLMFVLTGIEAVALILSISLMLPGQPSHPAFLPLNAGWSITVDQLKQAKTGLFGVGINDYASAFSIFRPAYLNQGTNWSIKFNASTDEWLTLATTMGLIGLITLVLIIITVIRSGFGNRQNSESDFGLFVAFLVTILGLTLIPANISFLFALFILALIILSQNKAPNLAIEEPIILTVSALGLGVLFLVFLGFILNITNNLLANMTFIIALFLFIGFTIVTILLQISRPKFTGLLPPIPVIVFILLTAYFLSRATRAELYFGQSLVYASENRGTETYNTQIQAIQLNPLVYRYRLAYSNTNLALANAIASQKNLSNDDKQKITQLISQSIREAKAAIAIDPNNSAAWINLALIYRQLINLAPQADQWTIASYVQAIRLDSTNPQLRLDLGGLLYSLQRYEDALDQFKQAISLKSDFPNAYYNLSYAYRQLKQYPQAYAAMQNVVSLIDSSSGDYDKAVNELNELQKLLPTQAQQASASAKPRESQLTKPQPTPSTKPSGPIDLNEQQKKELQPEIKPTPKPSATPNPVASGSATQP